jgi:hypothetical protein
MACKVGSGRKASATVGYEAQLRQYGAPLASNANLIWRKV